MSIPHVFSPVKASDFTIKPFQAHKRYVVSNTDYSASGYSLRDGLFATIKTPISSSKANNDPRNSDGSYKHIIWKSINQLYYARPYNLAATHEHFRRRFTWKQLSHSCSIFSIPYMDMGEKVYPGTIQMTSSNLRINDDGYGNLYDRNIITSSYANRHQLVSHWGFESELHHFRYGYGYKPRVSVKYRSNRFEVDDNSTAFGCHFQKGVDVNGTGSGMSVLFTGNSSLVTHHKEDFNFDGDFTISYWMKIPVSQSILTTDTNTIISKRGTVRKQVFGTNPKKSLNNLTIPTKYVSQSIVNDSTDVYPYHLELKNHTNSSPGKIVFKRSNGIRAISLESSSSLISTPNTWTHIAAQKTGSQLRLYVNGNLEASSSDFEGEYCFNDHMLIFGADNIDYKYGLSGSMDEIRFYNYACSPSSIETLADNTTGSLYQTSIIGNAFYRLGNIVITSPVQKYQKDLFSGAWQFKYRNTHTIYQFETFCRIKKGSHNLTMNPSARISPKSDMLTNDWTGSLIKPYVTSIGMYNTNGDLLAVAKMGQPLALRDDVDINIVIRFDV